MIKKPELISLGKAIRAKREALNIAQETFAVKVHIDRSYFGRIERGEANITFTLLLHITKNLHTTLRELLADVDEHFCS